MAAATSLPLPTSAFSLSHPPSKASHMHGWRPFSISVSFVNSIPATSYRSQQVRRYNCFPTVVSSSNSEGKPEKNGDPIVLTTTLYYVNAPPHMGSAYTTIAADALARFQDENELLEEKCCPIHRKPCEKRKEDNYFFSLSKYQRPLEELLTANPLFVQPPSRLHEVQNWVKSGLRDFSISRASVDWGFPVPNDRKQTIYVWFDALLGYISALLKDENEPTLDSAVAAGWPASVHLIGKDILRFHAVYWPAMLMSAGLNLPATVFGHGFLTKDGLKMGKSMGNVLEPRDLVERFGSDAVRYFFPREVEFGSDGDYSEERFISIVNAHLANTIGNLLNRTRGLLKKNCQSTLAFDANSALEDNTFKELVAKMVEKARNHYMDLSLSSACAAIIDIGNAGNIYLDERAPWSLFKQGGSSAEVAGKEDTTWGGLKMGQIMAEPQPIFRRIEDQEGEKPENIKAKKKKKKKGVSNKIKPEKNEILANT